MTPLTSTRNFSPLRFLFSSLSTLFFFHFSLCFAPGLWWWAHAQVTLKKNVVNVDFHVTRYKKIVESLQSELTSIKSQLRKTQQALEAARKQKEPASPAPALKEDILSRGIKSLMPMFSVRRRIIQQITRAESASRAREGDVRKAKREAKRADWLRHNNLMDVQQHIERANADAVRASDEKLKSDADLKVSVCARMCVCVVEMWVQEELWLPFPHAHTHTHTLTHAHTRTTNACSFLLLHSTFCLLCKQTNRSLERNSLQTQRKMPFGSLRSKRRLDGGWSSRCSSTSTSAMQCSARYGGH